MSELIRLWAAARGFLDLGRVKKRGNNGGRADTNSNAGFHKLATPFVVTLRIVAHSILASTGCPSPYDGGGPMKSTKELKCAGA
ncbi:hypothetical protein [Sphingomonas edaphi]|uniref:hypothetical protein n=1 Tax=Sphingomonas edaphi TaxID=2315689 RepID=UPI0018F28A11|nr:hypothetical protein [Sphingomonas edaphi]